MTERLHVRARHVRAGRLGRRALVIGVAVATSAAVLVGTAGPAPGANAGPRQGGEITYGLEAETGGGWCPRTSRLAISGIQVAAAIYDTLTVPNTKGKMVPYLAESVTPNDDFTQWTITLRDGITFHDGTPVDAAAVALNLEAYRASALIGTSLRNVAGVTVDSPSQLTVTTATPWPQFPWALYLDGRFAIVAPAQLNAGDACSSNLVGSGPFRLAEPWVVNQQLVVERNEDYWQEDAQGNQLPYLDRITFTPVADAGQRVNSLVGERLDVMHTSDGQQVDALQQQADTLTLMEEKPGRREVRYYLMNAAKPPLDDLNARTAVAMAIDREEINALRNNGIFTIANGPFDSKVMGYLKNPGFPKFNPTQAKKLVADYKATHGGEFSVVLEHTNDTANVAEAEILKRQLEEVGITASLKQDDQTGFITAAVSGNYSIMLWRQHPGDDPDAQYQWWQTGSLLNFGKFADPELQALLDQGRAATDAAERKQIYQDVNQRFADQRYNVWAYYSQWVIAAQDDVSGLEGPPLPDKGGKPLFLYGRHPLLGVSLAQ
jgi:peptide/nickel transport system substrate-binding protein